METMTDDLMDDAFDLARFVTAQDTGGAYLQAVAELRRGHKTGHWIWFVFPQIVGLGQSQMSRRFAISSLAEARAYLQHPVLGPRLAECAGIVAGTQKLRSSMTLFLRAAPGEPHFGQVLTQFFGGIPDEATDQLLAG
jgi:uncharacterized protein (DUF1810 family)